VFCLDSQAKAHAELGRTREAGNLWRRAYVHAPDDREREDRPDVNAKIGVT
jgi:hypothetical protein